MKFPIYLLFFYTTLLSCFGVEKFTPKPADPIGEPWRWKEEKTLGELRALCLDEAADGSIWFGNIGSIARYDGRELEVTYFDDALINKITLQRESPWAKAIHVLPNGRPLVLIGRSVVAWEKDGWRVIIQDVGINWFTPQFIQADDGSIWLLTPDGLWSMGSESLDPKLVLSAGEGNELVSFCKDTVGNLWIVEANQEDHPELIKINTADKDPSQNSNWDRFRIPDHRGLSEPQIVALSDGTLSYLSEKLGEKKWNYDPQKDLWKQSYSTGGSGRFNSAVKLQNDSILAGVSDGLMHFKRDEEPQFYQHDDLGIPRVSLKFFESSSQRLWIIGRIGYVFSVDLSETEWKLIPELNLQCETEDGILWFTSTRARQVVSHDPQTGDWFEHDSADHGIDKVELLFYSSHGLVWAAGRKNTRAAISIFDGEKWKPHPCPDFAERIQANAVFEASDGTIWFGGAGQRRNNSPQSGGALQFKVNSDKSITLLKHHSPSGFPYAISSFEQDPDGSLWLGSQPMHKYDPRTGDLTSHENLSIGNTVSIAENLKKI